MQIAQLQYLDKKQKQSQSNSIESNAMQSTKQLESLQTIPIKP